MFSFLNFNVMKRLNYLLKWRGGGLPKSSGQKMSFVETFKDRKD